MTYGSYDSNREYWVRPIRAFGYQDALCVDESACNFNLPSVTYESTNQPNDWTNWPSCEYAQEGYTCQGNEKLYEVGDVIQPDKIVFYVDSTGQHGLAALAADLASGSYVSWDEAMNRIINYNSESTSEWYLPSLYELNLMRIKIGRGTGVGDGLGNNIGSFGNGDYWSNTQNMQIDEGYGVHYWTLSFNLPSSFGYHDGAPNSSPAYYESGGRVRPICSF